MVKMKGLAVVWVEGEWIRAQVVRGEMGQIRRDRIERLFHAGTEACNQVGMHEIGLVMGGGWMQGHTRQEKRIVGRVLTQGICSGRMKGLARLELSEQGWHLPGDGVDPRVAGNQTAWFTRRGCRIGWSCFGWDRLAPPPAPPAGCGTGGAGRPANAQPAPPPAGPQRRWCRTGRGWPQGLPQG